MFAKYKKVIISVVIIVIVFLGFKFFKKDPVSDAELLTSTTNNSTGNLELEAADVLGAQIIQALNQINTLKLDRSIFTRDIYLSLVDKSEPIPLEPVGRPNPFAPLGRDIKRVTTATTSAPRTNPSQ